MSLRVQHERITAVERALRTQRAQTPRKLRQMPAPAFEFPRGMMRCQPRLQEAKSLLPRFNRALRGGVQIFPKIVEPLRPLPDHAARFTQRIA